MQPTDPATAAFSNVFVIVIACGLGLLAFAVIAAIIKAKIAKKRRRR
jgi:hypothetical protein